MQYQVPQFIDTEDKIVGPLSLRQFIYVGVGVGISAMLFFVLQMWLWTIVSAIIVGGAIAIAFVRVEGRPLTNIILSAFNFYWRPQTYVWQPEHPTLARSKAPKEMPVKKPTRDSMIEKIAAGMALHKSWESVQVGKKISDKEFVEEKMSGRYQIWRKRAGDRDAARRVDYR